MARVGKNMVLTTFDKAIEETLSLLEKMDDQVVRAQTSAALIEHARAASERFGEDRTTALVELRDLGWSLGDLAIEFELSRPRVAQISLRPEYKQRKTDRKSAR